MTIRNRKDFLAGTIFLLVGCGFAYASAQYRLGTPMRMGPGFFPLGLGLLLALMGAGVMALACRQDPAHPQDGGAVGRINLRGLLTVTAACIVFALAIRPAGLLLTVAATAIVASFAASPVRLPTILLNLAIQAVIALTVFHWLLALQIPLLPPRLLLF